MFSSAFEKVFLQVFNDVKAIVNKENNFQVLLYYHSVKAWCDTLKFDSEITNFIIDKFNNIENRDLPNYFLEEATNTPTFPLSKPKLKQFFEKIVNQIPVGKNYKLKLILIIAFGITAIGYLLYLIDQNQPNETTVQSSNLTRINRERINTTPPPVQAKINQVLILVINVSKSEIVSRLKEKRKVDTDDCEKLYRATEALWLGSKTELSPKITQSFSESNQFTVSSSEESEYNIYLIKIELSESDEGFKPNAGQLDRIDAFRRLADLSTNVEISPRLKIEASENTGVYSR